MFDEQNLDETKYYVKDLYEAAFLYVSGMKLENLEKADRVYYFVFSPKEKCIELKNQYWSMSSKSGTCPKLYADAIKGLKERIFANP